MPESGAGVLAGLLERAREFIVDRHGDPLRGKDCDVCDLVLEIDVELALAPPKLPVKFAADCEPCPFCSEPWCDECHAHYADCAHPGPDSEEESEDEAAHRPGLPPECRQ